MQKLIIALLLSSSVQAQDTLTIQDMQYNLYRSHQEYRAGIFLTLLGIGAVMICNDNTSRNIPHNEVRLVGYGAVIVGTVLHIDSHKWIGRCGKNRNKKRR